MSYSKATNDRNTADNAVASVTASAGSSESIYVSDVEVHYEGGANTDYLLEIKEAGTTIWSKLVEDEHGIQINFEEPLKLEAGANLTVEIPASGSVGIVGVVQVNYFKGD